MAKKKFDFTKSLTKTGLNIGGGVAANGISNKVMPNMNPKLKNGALLGLGIIAPAFVKNDMIEHLADGVATIAGVKLIGSFVPALAGIDDDYDDDDNIVSAIGYDSDDDYGYLDDEEDINGVNDDDDITA